MMMAAIYTEMKRSICCVTLILSIWLLAGCGEPTYRWEAFTMSSPPATIQPEMLKEEPIAVLPVQTPIRLVGYGPGVSQALDQTFAQSFPGIKAIPSKESVNRMSRAGAQKEFAQLVEFWKTSEIYDRAGLEKIGAALEVRYLLLPGIVEFDRSMIERFDLVGLRTVQTRTVTLRLSLQLWDVTSGVFLWESFGEGIWRSMIEDLLQGKTDSYYAGVEPVYTRPLPRAQE
jgi:hypothetical protein